MINDFIDSLLAKLATKFKPTLINKKSVKSKFDESNNMSARWIAYGAFKGTSLEIDDGGFPNRDYSSIPDEYIQKLMSGTFAQIKIGKVGSATLNKIQNKFTVGWQEKVDGKVSHYAGFQDVIENNYKSAARPYIKTVFVYVGVVLTIIGASCWGLYKYKQAQDLKQYWVGINTSKTYYGDGFTAVFPCSDVKDISLLADADLNSHESSCEYFSGYNHTQIDIYSVHVEHFLSSKYNPSDEMSCPSPYIITGNPDTQTYFSETRSRDDGLTFVLCGKGSSPISAFVQKGNTVYSLSVEPADTKTTASKLDNFIRGFQVTNSPM